MPDLLLGIDIGTGSCKCSLVDLDGRLVASAGQEYRPLLPRPGWVEQDPADWYRAVIKSLQQLTGQAGIDLSRVCAVGTTGQMRGPTFLDRAGEPVRPSILWNDLRCEQEVAELNAGYAEPLRRITYNPLNTMCTLPKLVWLLRHEPETWARTVRLLYPKDYINFCLTGQAGTDLSDASGSSFYDLKKQAWSDEILERLTISREKLPDIHASTHVIGRVRPAAGRETGLNPGTPVVAGGSDATVELLATGIKDSRQCKIRLGTSGALSTLVDRLDDRLEGRYYCWSYLVPGRWMIDVNTRTCADATVWLKDVFFKEIVDSQSAYRQIEQEARQAPPGSEGLFFHPYLLGEDAPYWQPHLKGSFFGLSLYHRRPHCARAVLEGTGFALRDARSILGRLGEGFEEYIFVGGGVKNVTWLEIVADILGIDARVAGQTDASLGAAMLAGVGAGVFRSLAEAADACATTWGVVRHTPERHQEYSRFFRQYRRMKQVFDNVYEDTTD